MRERPAVGCFRRTEEPDTPSLVRVLQLSVVCSTPIRATVADPCCALVSGILNLDE
jgi:hypothetical protein